MAQAVILLGGNLGDRFYYLTKAKEFISKRIGTLRKISSIYETEAWGFNTETQFLNQVIIVETGLSPHELLHQTQSIENLLGRVRNINKMGYESRIIDIDILFYDSEIIETPELQIPHINLHLRKFTLIPLAEIIPFWIHPILGETVENLALNCFDKAEVKKRMKSYV
jgi:2-amino-4-hydroxy-6-hydroxymethyldihydropteridine diphosphokinase